MAAATTPVVPAVVTTSTLPATVSAGSSAALTSVVSTVPPGTPAAITAVSVDSLATTIVVAAQQQLPKSTENAEKTVAVHAISTSEDTTQAPPSANIAHDLSGRISMGQVIVLSVCGVALVALTFFMISRIRGQSIKELLSSIAGMIFFLAKEKSQVVHSHPASPVIN